MTYEEALEIVNELIDVNKVSYLKDLTGLDIMKSISINHDIKKAEEEEMAKNLQESENEVDDEEEDKPKKGLAKLFGKR